ncbi:MAG: energy transducer TonB, partial [Bacteroidia bacterium]|nr:energy transducer TonB [Bacteroidia bacterium]
CLFLACLASKAQPSKDTVPFVCYYPIPDMPQFPGGNDSLKSYLRRNLKWPGHEWDWEGTVYVKFKVDCKGDISNATVLRGLDSLANKEALRLIKGMPKWVNVNCVTQPVPVWYNLPIKFRKE